MKHEPSNLIRGGRACSLALALALAACTPNADPGPAERVAGARNRVFASGDRETGTADTPPPARLVTPCLDPGADPAAADDDAGDGDPLPSPATAPSTPSATTS